MRRMNFRNLFYSLLCVAVPAKPSPPTLVSVSIWSLTISYRPPRGLDPSRRIVYVIQYRKQGQTDWASLRETTKTRVVITNLQAKTKYEFTVAVKYVGGELGPSSDPVQADTHSGKCSKTSYRRTGRGTCRVC